VRDWELELLHDRSRIERGRRLERRSAEVRQASFAMLDRRPLIALMLVLGCVVCLAEWDDDAVDVDVVVLVSDQVDGRYCQERADGRPQAEQRDAADPTHRSGYDGNLASDPK
jgi:hypothetical protein